VKPAPFFNEQLMPVDFQSFQNLADEVEQMKAALHAMHITMAGLLSCVGANPFIEKVVARGLDRGYNYYEDGDASQDAMDMYDVTANQYRRSMTNSREAYEAMGRHDEG